MGIYLNPGNENFRRTLAAKIYVDKTMMIERINEFIDEGNNYVCISRPRRFGKTIAGNMLSSYYSKGCDSSELFAPLKIARTAGYKERLNKLNVIKIDLNSEYQNTIDREDFIEVLTGKIRKEMIAEYPGADVDENDSVADAIMKVYVKTKETFVIIIDEYDVLVREEVSEKLFARYLQFLNGLFKSDTLRQAISLAYITGIMPVVRDKIQSKLNNFREYTILEAGPLAEYIGFTSEEVKELCDKYSVDFNECRVWYDGYRQNGIEIYNPESVVMSMTEGRFSSYWGRTSTYEAISDRIENNFDGIKDDVVRMLAGEEVDVNVTRFMNTMKSFHTKSDAFTYLIHLGYLAYNIDESTCYIPNKEVRQEWINAIETDADYKVTDKIIKASKELFKETMAGNEEAVAEALDESHIHVTSNRSYNNEDALCSAIYLSYIYALNYYTCIKEMTAGKGFADVIYIPIFKGSPALIVELKHNKSPESALEQIKEKKYFDAFDSYSGDIIFVGIDYDEKDKTHSCRIERFVKE